MEMEKVIWRSLICQFGGPGMIEDWRRKTDLVLDRRNVVDESCEER